MPLLNYFFFLKLHCIEEISVFRISWSNIILICKHSVCCACTEYNVDHFEKKIQQNDFLLF